MKQHFYGHLHPISKTIQLRRTRDDKSWKQHPTKQQLYGHLHPISKTIQLRRTRDDKSWKQHPTKQQLYGHLHPIPKTIQLKRTIDVRHCWRNKDELISDVLQWTPTHERASFGRPARTYSHQLCSGTGCT